MYAFDMYNSVTDHSSRFSSIQSETCILHISVYMNTINWRLLIYCPFEVEYMYCMDTIISEHTDNYIVPFKIVQCCTVTLALHNTLIYELL